MHHLCGVVDVLNRILCLWFFHDIRCRNPLCRGKLRHDMGLNEAVMRRPSRHDEAWSNPGLILADTLQNALPLFRRRCPIKAGRRSQNNDRVEVAGASIAGR